MSSRRNKVYLLEEHRERERLRKGQHNHAGGDAMRGNYDNIDWGVWFLLLVHTLFCKVWLGMSSDQITEISSSEPPQQHDEGDDGVRLGQPRSSALLSSVSRSRNYDVISIKDTAAVEVHSTYLYPDVDVSFSGKGLNCGAPLSEPCFDFERCRNGSSGIYVYDGNCSLADSSALLRPQEKEQDRWKQKCDDLDLILRNEAEKAGLLAQTYESACLFVAATTRFTSCAVGQPLWNSGSNHLLVDLSDRGRNRRREVADSYAMEAASNMRTSFYRTGYDISVPLAPRNVFPALAAISPWDRQFFLTTKGSVYLSRGGSEERMSLVPLHDERNGVVMSLHCFEMHGEHLLPENVEYCKSLKDRYDDHDYEGLMNTTFGLVPAGRSPGTYRLGEVMSAGSIPVFVGRDMVLPFREDFDWPSFSFMFSPDQVGSHMVRTLQAVSRAELEEMQRKLLEVYREMFGTDKRDFRPMANKIIDILHKRLGHRSGL